MTLKKRILKLSKEECEKCGYKENLELHHIDINPINNDVYNLMKLCIKCHSKQHIGSHNLNVQKRKCRFCSKEFVIRSQQHYFCSEGCRRGYREVLESGSIFETNEMFAKRVENNKIIN